MPYPTDRSAPTSISPLVSSIRDNRISPPGPTSRAPDRQTARIGAALSRRRLVREDYGEHVIENPVHQVIVLGDQGNRLNRHLGIPSVTCHAEVGYVREIIYDLRPADQSIHSRPRSRRGCSGHDFLAAVRVVASHHVLRTKRLLPSGQVRQHEIQAPIWAVRLPVDYVRHFYRSVTKLPRACEQLLRVKWQLGLTEWDGIFHQTF